MLLEPHGHRRRERHLEYAHGRAEDDAEEQIELPQAGHKAGQHHPGDEQKCADGHGDAGAVAVAQPSGRRPQHSRHHPLQREPEPHRAVAPAEGIHQPRNQDAGRRAEGGAEQPHHRGHSHDDPGIVHRLAGDDQVAEPEGVPRGSFHKQRPANQRERLSVDGDYSLS